MPAETILNGSEPLRTPKRLQHMREHLKAFSNLSEPLKTYENALEHLRLRQRNA